MDQGSPLIQVVTTRKCPGKDGSHCNQFMADSAKDPHTLCAKCKGQPCSRNNNCDECRDWSSEQWNKFEKIKRSKKDNKLADLESNFSQFSADFTSHRLSTDETLSSLKSDFETIMTAIQSLKGPTAPPAGVPATAEQSQDPPRHNDPHGNQQSSLTAEEEGELLLTHEEVLLEGEEETAPLISHGSVEQTSQPPPLLGPFGNPPRREREPRNKQPRDRQPREASPRPSSERSPSRTPRDRSTESRPVEEYNRADNHEPSSHRGYTSPSAEKLRVEARGKPPRRAHDSQYVDYEGDHYTEPYESRRDTHGTRQERRSRREHYDTQAYPYERYREQYDSRTETYDGYSPRRDRSPRRRHGWEEESLSTSPSRKERRGVRTEGKCRADPDRPRQATPPARREARQATSSQARRDDTDYATSPPRRERYRSESQ